MVTPSDRVNSAVQQVIPSFNKSKTTELGLKDTTANASTTTSQYTSHEEIPPQEHLKAY